MAMSISFETPVGYISNEDIYITYSEYYGDGTIYGRVDLLTAEGEPVKGAGKTKMDLINANVVISDIMLGSVSGDLVNIPNEITDEFVSQEVTEDVAVTAENNCSGECPCNDAIPVKDEPVNDRYTVSLSVLGLSIKGEFRVKIDNETREIYLNQI